MAGSKSQWKCHDFEMVSPFYGHNLPSLEGRLWPFWGAIDLNLGKLGFV